MGRLNHRDCLSSEYISESPYEWPLFVVSGGTFGNIS